MLNEPLLSCKTTCAFSEMPTDDVEGQSQRRPSTSPHETSERDWLKQNSDARSLWPKDDAGVFRPLSRRALLGTVHTYFLRWKGDGERHPPPPPIYRTVLAWLGSFLSLLLIGGMHQWINTQWSLPLLLSTFGPACALVFGLPTLPASQPLNCMGGNLVGGIVGLFWRVLVGRQAWLAMALSCSTAIAAMEMTSLQYPPGITTSLLLSTIVPESTFQPVSIGNNVTHNWCIRTLLEHSLLLRFTDGCKILLSTVIGHVVIILVALIVNNLHPNIGYPKRWL